ncbi:hypothetical protein C6W89_08580 [Halomonas sp. SYSU XM8]|nr:hypothetical protein C6W89_08580 [Halomonas sp. SYSU XM8]
MNIEQMAVVLAHGVLHARRLEALDQIAGPGHHLLIPSKRIQQGLIGDSLHRTFDQDILRNTKRVDAIHWWLLSLELPQPELL